MQELAETMKAVVTSGAGGYDRLEYRDVAVPEPGAGEVLLRVLAAGVNNTEINTRLGWAGDVDIPPPPGRRRNRGPHRHPRAARVGSVGAGNLGIARGGPGDAPREAFRIDAWVVLPDHMHCVWTLPEGDCGYGVRVGAIKSRFTRAVGTCPADASEVVEGNPIRRSPSKVRKGDAGIWQRWFCEHHIRNDEDFAAHLRYCWFNPVKHGFVDDPAEWPYSSYHRDSP